MRAHLLTIGDELLIGQTTNTNAAWLGERLSLMGVRVDRVVTMPDEDDAIRTELDRAYADVPLVVTTGGLGPTHDDVTKTVVADYFGKALHTDDDLLARVRSYYERRDRDLPEAVATLAQVPEGFELLENPVGTAAGLWYAGENAHDECLLAVLPGVPQEMKSIFSAAVQPRLEARTDLQDVKHRTLLTTGIGESDLQATLGDLSAWLDDQLRLAYLPSTSGVRLRMTAYGDNPEDAQARLDTLEAVLRERAGTYIFGMGDDTLEGVLGTMLRERGLTVATAESATGGLIGHRLTNESGSSDYYLGSIISYANAVKVHQLGVSEHDLEAHGAVSEPVARQMARGVRAAIEADVGVSTTGIAGPTGGTEEKPVGTVWVGYADANTEHARRLQLTQDRHLNKELFATSALDMIRRQLRRQAANKP